jgi:N-methylhydantoinase A
MEGGRVFTGSEPGKLINIDNGGTLTDVCVIDGGSVYRTKTLTTPHDLAQCLLDGLKKVSKQIYGVENLLELMRTTHSIRYSTTQGTNALVERKGSRLGLILGGGLEPARLTSDHDSAGLFAAIVGDRCEVLDAHLDAAALDSAAARAVNALSSAGSNRVVVAFAGADRSANEARIKRVLLRTFPPHLLGALPILYSTELEHDADDARRAWTALLNAFLHPSMERFLYRAEHKLREVRAQNPLLIFRNDGYSARVAQTVAIKTYSSGPRGGMEGAKAIAAHHGFARLLTMDVGGTTTDVGLVENGSVRSRRRGAIEGIATSIELCDVASFGVGGSSIFRVDERSLRVGPESVGSTPGPACFGLGGKKATMTDAFVVAGLLDPASYFGGELPLDIGRASAAVKDNIARPLGISVEDAVIAMEQAWVGKIANALTSVALPDGDTVLAAFGGAGPLTVCAVAERSGVSRVIIPRLAAVFSAFGIGFSDIGHEFSSPVDHQDGIAGARSRLLDRARRAMYAEGADLADCHLEEFLSFTKSQGAQMRVPLDSLADIEAASQVSVTLRVIKPVPHAQVIGRFAGSRIDAVANGRRAVLCAGRRQELPLYRVEEQSAGRSAIGPAVLEEPYFTCRVDAGWEFAIGDSGDILLSRTREGGT